MSIKKNFFAPLSSGLGATRRAAMLLLVMMLTTAMAWAQNESEQCGDNLTWELNDNTLTISGSGAMYDYDLEVNPTPWSSYADQINEVVIGNGVTSIGALAFSDCNSLGSVTFAEGSQLKSIGALAFSSTGLTSIEIPASVTSIGECAFIGCQCLTSITFAKRSQLESIGESAFSSSLLTSIEIPAGVTSIGEAAFFECTNLGSVTFAEGSQLESIGEYAFSRTGLTSIEIPASVTSIGSYVFQNCDNLASMAVEDGNTVYDSRNGCNAIIEKSSNTLIAGCKNTTIPDGVTSIGNYAFYTTRLTSIEIPASVTSIGIRAFQNCPNLATVTVYAPSCTLGVKAFAYCNNLANIYVFSDKVDTYKGAENWSDYKDIITGITGGYCGTTDHETDVIWVLTGESPNYTLTISGTGAMADYSSPSNQPWKGYRSSIKTIVIGNGVTSIGSGGVGGGAFRLCDNLATVTFAEGSQLTSIGTLAFANTGLTSIEIPASVTSIGNNAFISCSNLASMTVADGNTVYDSRNGCNAIIEKSTNTLIIGCKNSTIPAGVTSIGNYAFNGCTGLTSIEIPAGVTSIGNDAFNGCTGLTSIEIPAGVTIIGKDAFYGCTGLTSIEIPAGVTSIGQYAFNYCGNLATVTVYALECSLGENAFNKCTKLTKIYVFSDYVEYYQYAINWRAYAGKITAIEGIALADNADNSSLITAANGSTLNVTLQGRTLYKDGAWNTLCLPFALSAEQIAASPLAGCTLMELDTEGTYDTDKQTGYDSESGTLYLYFKEATAIEAGKPYLVKWESGSNITDPVFYGVTVSNEDPENRKAISYDHNVTFIGNYSPVALTGGDASNLYLGAANKLYWPSADCTINAFRGYFHVDLSNGAKVREIRLSLDDNVTSIQNAEFIIHNYNGGATYNLSGQKVSDDYKGIVIKNGRKYLK